MKEREAARGQDPARIKRMLNQIYEVWKAYPDKRLLQVICAEIPRDIREGMRDLSEYEDRELEADMLTAVGRLRLQRKRGR